MVSLTKEEKENWIIDIFLELFSSKEEENYSILKKIPEDEAPGPDYLIYNSKGTILGVEVCELLDYPSSHTGEQRVKEKLFEEIIYNKIQGVPGLYLSYKTKALPKNNKEIKSLANRTEERVKQLLKSSLKEGNFTINGIEFRFFLVADSQQVIVGKEYSADSDKFYSSILSLVDDKVKRSKKYCKRYPIILAIYNNTEQSIFNDDNTFKSIISSETTNWKQFFYEVWLVGGYDTVDGKVYGEELISYVNTS